MKKEEVKLLDGTLVIGDAFDHDDFIKLQDIFDKWNEINTKLKSLGGRNLNVPDVFSEAIFCLVFDAVRTNGTAHSYDCVLRKTGEGVQIKSGSIQYDCTSFGPTSTWDLLYYADFASNGHVDGIIKFYQIDDTQVYNLVLNTKKNETFKDQQLQGRRPRFSIKRQIIEKYNLQPIKTINLVDGTIE